MMEVPLKWISGDVAEGAFAGVMAGRALLKSSLVRGDESPCKRSLLEGKLVLPVADWSYFLIKPSIRGGGIDPPLKSVAGMEEAGPFLKSSLIRCAESLLFTG